MEEMHETRYSFAHIAKVVDLDVQNLEKRRRNTHVWWNPKGYTLEEVKKIIGTLPLMEREAVENCRSPKAKALYALLKK
jgi:hypothetical protein